MVRHGGDGESHGAPKPLSLPSAVDLHLKSEIVAPVMGHAVSMSFAGAIFVGA